MIQNSLFFIYYICLNLFHSCIPCFLAKNALPLILLSPTKVGLFPLSLPLIPCGELWGMNTYIWIDIFISSLEKY